MAGETIRALRAAHPELRISPEMAAAFERAWVRQRMRPTVPCPSPGPHPIPEARPAGSPWDVLHAAGVDSTIPPDDTVSTWVKVFLDFDEDGEFDAGEEGIDAIQVGNGTIGAPGNLGSALTDTLGTHTFTTPLYDSRFVFVTVPSGYTATTSFFHRITAGVAQDTAYFGLRATPATANVDFRMVQIADMQVTDAPQSGLEHSDDLTEIEQLAVPPDFIVVTGDLVQTGERQVQFESYLLGTLGHQTLIHHGYGDHDGLFPSHPTWALKVRNFEDWIGPSCYSFDYGNVHFVMYNDFDPTDVAGDFIQFGWLPFDIVTARGRNPDVQIVICKHRMPDQEELNLYHQFPNMLGTFSGHWHGSRLRDVQDIFDVNTPPSRYPGIDKSSRGFRIIDVGAGGISTHFREGGVTDHLRIVHPADGDSLLAVPTTIWVNAFGSSAVDQTVDFSLVGPGGPLPPQPMTREGSWAWSGAWDPTGEPLGNYTLTVTVTPDNRPPYFETAAFELVAGEFVAQPDPFSDWPSYKYDVAGTGRSPVDLVPPLRLAWMRNLGSLTNVSSPSVAGGRVYLGTSNISTTAEARLFCLDAATGNTLWQVPARTDVKSTPTVAGGAVYFTNSIGTVFSLDALTGDILWQRQLGDSLFRWEMTSPTVFDGRVYVGGAPAMSALNASDGTPLWSAAGDDTDFIPATYSKPAVDDQVVVFTNKSGIYVYDRVTGVPVWSNSSGTRPHRSPAIVDSLVYTAGQNFGGQKLRAYDLMTGALVYEPIYNLFESTSAPVVGPGPGGVGWRAVVGHGGKHDFGQDPVHGRVYSFLPPATDPGWTHLFAAGISGSAPYKRDVVSINSTPAWAGDHLYFGADDGILYCLDPESGAELWRHDLGVPIRSSPAAAGNMLFVSGFDGTLYAFVSTFLAPAAAGPAGGAPGPRTRLLGNRPNPFNPATDIYFDLGAAGGGEQPVSLKIYDPAGRLVRTLLAGRLAPGPHRVTWDGRDHRGRRVASSVYFYELRAGDLSFRRKLVLAK